MRRFIACLGIMLSLAGSGAKASDTARFVVLGENGTASVRAVTHETTCPNIRIDGRTTGMSVRAAPGTMPTRPTISAPDRTKPSAFPVLTCETTLPPHAAHAAVAGRSVRPPKPVTNRIVVIGDTGCRIKGKSIQACADAAAWPFATVAARAAAWKPDLVIHVGDYLYLETECPDADRRCAGFPWGYGWDAWNADFFAPAAPLLRAAPWVFVRGNHENCDRAGQGWWRFLDPHPLTAGRDCADPANDAAGDDSPTYAVPLGHGAQIVTMDMAFADDSRPLDPASAKAAPIAAAYRALNLLSRQAKFTFAVTHKPILGFSASQKNGAIQLRPGNQAIQSVFTTLNPDLLPAGVGAILGGHYHLWEQVSFASNHPSQFIAGISGTQEDTLPMPETLPPDAAPAPAAKPDRFSSWVDGFGYMTLERQDARRWDVKVWNLAGRVVNRCHIDGHHSACGRARAG